jgi:hypothetical protein
VEFLSYNRIWDDKLVWRAYKSSEEISDNEQSQKILFYMQAIMKIEIKNVD